MLPQFPEVTQLDESALFSDFKFIAEKVSHNPVVMAFHSDGKAWKLDGYAAPSQKFWGRSMEVNVSGDYKISFPDKQEVYSIRKPASFV